MSHAVIDSARLAAAHEGIAELVITLRHDNGGISEVALDHLSATALLASCDATVPEQLNGHSWEKVRDALGVSWNRFQT
jgi:hypothetical protein